MASYYVPHGHGYLIYLWPGCIIIIITIIIARLHRPSLLAFAWLLFSALSIYLCSMTGFKVVMAKYATVPFPGPDRLPFFSRPVSRDLSHIK